MGNVQSLLHRIRFIVVIPNPAVSSICEVFNHGRFIEDRRDVLIFDELSDLPIRHNAGRVSARSWCTTLACNEGATHVSAARVGELVASSVVRNAHIFGNIRMPVKQSSVARLTDLRRIYPIKP